jgi:multiple sugar transport system permease protein
MAICVPVGYASSRYEFTGRRFVQGLGIAGYILSPVILAIPYFRLLATVDLTNSVVGITLLHVALSIPFCLSLLDLLFQSVPSAPEEVALLAGMEGLTLLRQIVLPSARLPILAIGLLAFLVSWKEYFYSFVVSSGENSRTLPLLLSAMMAGEVPQ